MNKPFQRISAVDGLKGLLALVVVLWHYYLKWSSLDSQRIPGPILLHPVWMNGSLAVEFFFLLSGFLMALKYRKIICSTTAYDYASKRLRMFQPWTFATLFSIVLIAGEQLLFHGNDITEHKLTFQHVLFSLTFVQTGWFTANPKPLVDPLWFVCVLILCYAVYYAVVRLCKTKTAYLSACSVMVCLGICLMLRKPDFPFFFYENGRGYAPFFLGALLEETISAKIRWNRLIPPIFILLSALYVCNLVAGPKTTFGNIRICATLFIFPSILLLALKSRMANAVFSSFPCRFLGKISMAIFATHWQIMWIWAACYRHSAIPATSGWFFLSFLLSVILFAILWHETIEKRIAPHFFRFVHNTLILPEQPR